MAYNPFGTGIETIKTEVITSKTEPEMLSKEIYQDYFEQILDVRARLIEQASEIVAEADDEALQEVVRNIAAFGERQLSMAEELSRLLNAA